ncbi:TPA: DNA/RNA non-specific endonuclease [Streptococcus suis]|nr:DNA/RNA non-specific endonuclease [Streptococcus suis]MCK3975200.1 DNA/RNA non-specific endonuclease [Streptococcus suis]MDW8575925.1 DNA/RNA non-specific endonuclease [Streptococcus suis]MDW8589258.1 DNA/RNA non-specific endonuclease [Streptococcus suis]MDW8615836.1 DNA/RNA non-specific endonuclease [Streptococcus suis]NQK51459.1 DNA/RNA non-specific endonuclease [Streptococcus suis]
MKRICLFLLVFISFLVSGFPVKANQESIDYGSLNLIPFNGNKQIVLGEFDTLGRATSAHIQLQDKDEPKKRREPRIKFTPVGWHNYKIAYGNQGKKSWLFNRGHLIGYQFSGLTDEGKNLVPLTAWTNSGNYKGTDDSNFESMLYYENRLDSWLANHPHFWLDYKVTPIYSGDELIPRQISLQYVGLDESGYLININLGSPKESVDGYGITTVILDNYSKNATIDYLKGTATPSLVSTDETSQTASSSVAPESQLSESSQVAQSETQLAPVVYIARNGNADVYWYSKENMPANTNFAKVIEMSEEQALSLGKRHTTKE